MTTIVERFDRVFPPVVSGDAPNRLYMALTRLPDRLLQILLSIFVASYVMAEFGLYRPYTVVPLAVILIVLSWRLIPSDVVPTRGHAIATIVAVVGALAWVIVQLPFETEFVIASRDPGIYSNLAATLAHTGHSSLDVSKAVSYAQGIPNASANLGSFHPVGSTIELQGGNALPSMLGLGYWIGGINGLTIVNSVIGGVALVAVFTLARRILGPAWGLLPPVILGLSMPMVYFARAPYTEILSLAIFIGAVSVFWSALATGRTREFVMAGVFAGAACMTRIDALLGVAALIASFVAILVGFARPRADYDLRRAWIAYVIPAVVLGGLGAYDLLHNYNAYVQALGGQSKSLWELAIGLVVIGFVVVGVRTLIARLAVGRGRSTSAVVATGGLGRPVGDRGAKIVAVVLVVLIPLVFVFWALRPNFIAYHYNPQVSVQQFTSTLQRNFGLPVDGSRSYDEYSLYWFVWYFGIPFVVVTCLGLMGLLYKAIAKRSSGLLVFSVLTLGVALLYLNRISIAPDQMWAFRRVLPVVTPGFIIAAVFAVKWVASRRGSGGSVVRGQVGAGIAGALAAVLVAGTIGAWSPRLFVTTEYSNQATEVRTICAEIGDHSSAILVTRESDSYALSIKNFCNVDVVSVATNTVEGATASQKTATLEATQTTLAALEARMGAGTPVVVFDSTIMPWQGAEPKPLQSIVIDVWQRTLLSQPHTFSVTGRTTWMGTLTPSGLVKGE